MRGSRVKALNRARRAGKIPRKPVKDIDRAVRNPSVKSRPCADCGKMTYQYGEPLLEDVIGDDGQTTTITKFTYEGGARCKTCTKRETRKMIERIATAEPKKDETDAPA